MCGIIGFVGGSNAVPVILEGLKKLEYRGYDSSGIAVNNGDRFNVVKKKGRIKELESAIKKSPISGNIGIGHTRWATHGEPSDANSHPHLGGNSRIAVVHNGIIENYKKLKERLEAKGVKFNSQTDSEVVAQLAEHYCKEHHCDLLDTVVRVTNALEGSYALGIMSVGAPDTLIATKKDNPLIIGVGTDGNYIASDVPAILKHTNKVYYLDDKEIAVIRKDSVEFYNSDREKITKELKTITWDAGAAEKGGHKHFMKKEMLEQPKIIKDTFSGTSKILTEKASGVLDKIDINKFNKIVITACGSAYNAGVVAKYVFEKLCRIPIETELASEFRYKDPIVDEKTLVVLVSQSGETADTIAAMREAKKRGATTLGVVNVIGSAIATECDVCLYTAAGPEIAVATTKAFSAQLIVLYMLAVHFAKKLSKIDDKKAKAHFKEIEKLPASVETVLANSDDIKKYAASVFNSKSIFFIGRNIDYAIALEGSLKLKEISYIHSEAYAGGELKHGTISLITDDVLVVAIATCKNLVGKTASNVEQVMSRGAKVLWIGQDFVGTKPENLYSIKLPEVDELFSPSVSVIALQLLSYYVAANKGLDIDKPRNLAKSVTVE